MKLSNLLPPNIFNELPNPLHITFHNPYETSPFSVSKIHKSSNNSNNNNFNNNNFNNNDNEDSEKENENEADNYEESFMILENLPKIATFLEKINEIDDEKTKELVAVAGKTVESVFLNGNEEEFDSLTKETTSFLNNYKSLRNSIRYERVSTNELLKTLTRIQTATRAQIRPYLEELEEKINKELHTHQELHHTQMKILTLQTYIDEIHSRYPQIKQIPKASNANYKNDSNHKKSLITNYFQPNHEINQNNNQEDIQENNQNKNIQNLISQELETLLQKNQELRAQISNFASSKLKLKKHNDVIYSNAINFNKFNNKQDAINEIISQLKNEIQYYEANILDKEKAIDKIQNSLSSLDFNIIYGIDFDQNSPNLNLGSFNRVKPQKKIIKGIDNDEKVIQLLMNGNKNELKNELQIILSQCQLLFNTNNALKAKKAERNEMLKFKRACGD